MKKDDDHDEKRIKCLLMGHRHKLIIRKDVQGGFFMSVQDAGKQRSE